MTTIYASPDHLGVPGDGVPTSVPGAPGTPEAPMRLGDAMVAGCSTVVAKQGIYRGEASRLNWRGGTVKHVIGEDAWLDGEMVRSPFTMRDCDGCTLEGSVNAYNAHHQAAVGKMI